MIRLPRPVRRLLMAGAQRLVAELALADVAELADVPEYDPDDTTPAPDPQWCPVTWGDEGHACALDADLVHRVHFCDCGEEAPRRHLHAVPQPPSSAQHWPPWALDKIADAVAGVEDDTPASWPPAVRFNADPNAHARLCLYRRRSELQPAGAVPAKPSECTCPTPTSWTASLDISRETTGLRVDRPDLWGQIAADLTGNPDLTKPRPPAFRPDLDGRGDE